MATVLDPSDLFLGPVIRRSPTLIDDNVYTFVVQPDSNKDADQRSRSRRSFGQVGGGEHSQPPGARRKARQAGYGKRKSTKSAS